VAAKTAACRCGFSRNLPLKIPSHLLHTEQAFGKINGGVRNIQNARQDITTKAVVVKMNDNSTFGAFIRQKRMGLDPHISLRKMATLLNLSPVHMSNIETGREAAPKKEVLDNLVRFLKLNKQEQEILYDLAAESKNYTAIPSDLPEYITTHEYAKIALRVAKEVDATDEEWMEFIEKLKKRSKGEKKE